MEGRPAMSTTHVRGAFDSDGDAQVSRELLGQLDDAPTSREHYKIMFISGMGFFTDAYDLFVIGIVATLVTAQWHISGTQKSLLTSLALLSSAAGAIAFGRIADRLGRKKIYGYEVLVLAVGAIATSLSPGIWWLIGFRAILGFGIGGDYPVSATIMSNRGRMVSLVFAMQGLGLIVGPLLAIILLSTGMSENLVWRLLLAFGAIPALSVFYLRRQLNETPRFQLAQIEGKEADEKAKREGKATGMRGVLADRRLLRWLIGASVAWFLFDLVYYGNTISTPIIVKLVAPHATLITQTAYILGIFGVFAFPAYFLAAFTIDHIGRRRMQFGGFIMIALAFFGLWLVPGATTTVVPFLLLFGATYFFAEFGPNTTTFVYPAEIFPVRVRTSSHGIAAASGKIGAFVGTYALTALLPRIGLGSTSALVGGVAAVGAVITITMLPEPKGQSLEEITEETTPQPTSVSVLGLAHSRGVRPPAA
jgi:PHS family inorganic phosphate transporter-like MFS transporter